MPKKETHTFILTFCSFLLVLFTSPSAARWDFPPAPLQYSDPAINAILACDSCNKKSELEPHLKNNPEAQHLFARLNSGARGGDQDVWKRWMKKSADSGYPQAMFDLALGLTKNRGDETDQQEGIEYALQAAYSNHEDAQNFMGNAYWHGHYGVSQDESQAFAWLSRAARSGQPAAQASLAYFFLEGIFVEKNPRLAYVWALVARINGIDRNNLALHPARIQVEDENSEAMVTQLRKVSERCILSEYRNCSP